MSMWRREPFDIDAWRRRHPMGQPSPRAKHETTAPMSGRLRYLALREERRQELAAIAEREKQKHRDAHQRDAAWRHEWEAARDAMWEERRSEALVERDA